ncbi:SpoIIE family protein phosphatase [Actinomadura verrucosospora]|uniref:PAS protein phosphatase 2C-like n=1 Tax=Actinomadura verrucosospora TaxID=46165 RepID=A0A7D3VS87_ACTVE|nr:SpoIIE family protein phosphatase [Actinomadura verrucosospora]QKG21600.1 PAS protein phosphatase 2C-like [Actinomadura verrucosospora]
MVDERQEGDGGTASEALRALDAAPATVAVISGPEQRLAYTNIAFRATFGDRAVGEPVRRAFGDLVQTGYFDLLARVLDGGEPVTLAEAPVSLFFPDTGYEERFFSFSLSRVPGDEPAVLAVGVDVSERVGGARRAGRTADEQRRALRRFQSLIRVSAEIVWVTNPAGEPVEPSPGWERVTGQSWAGFRGKGWQSALHPEDREDAVRSWERALAQARPWRYVYRLRTAGGGYRHFQVNAAPVHENGVVVEWVGTCTDIEQQWRRERRTRLLDRAAAATAERTGLREMLGALADVLVPALADGCGVHLLPDYVDRPDGAPLLTERVATAARAGLPRQPPAGVEWYAADSGFTRTVQRSRPLHHTFPPGRPPADMLPAGTTEWLAAADANSVVVMPVTVDGAVAAVVTAAVCGEREPLSREDVDLMRQMFEHAHDGLSSAIEYHRTQRVALALQHGLLAEPPRVPGLEIVARYRASPATAEVGGDWYDSFVLPDGAAVLAIGDATGHDLGAAVAMSQLRNILRALIVDRQEGPGHILRRLNIAMETLIPDGSATCALARVAADGPGGPRLEYAAAGHPPPVLVAPDGTTRLLEDAANPLLGLGVLFDEPYRSAQLALDPGCTLLLYTDGLVERPGEHLDEGLTRLRDEAGRLARRSLPAFCDGLLTRLPTAGIDDMAMIALRVPPA